MNDSVSQYAKIFVVFSSFNFFCSMSCNWCGARNAVRFSSIFVDFLFSFLVQTEFFRTEINFYYLKYDGQRVQQSHKDGMSLLFEKHSTPTGFVGLFVFVCVCLYIQTIKVAGMKICIVLCLCLCQMLEVKILTETFSRSPKCQFERKISTQNSNEIHLFLCWMNIFDFARKFKLNPVIKIRNTQIMIWTIW